MAERTGLVAVEGNPLTITGNEVGVGDKAPAFTVAANDLSLVESSAYDGKVRIISAVPSLETSVCDVMTRRFNQEAAGLDDDVVVLTISMDLPLAQAKWCGTAGVDRVVTLSDFRGASFGSAFGVLIKETGLLARSVFVVDREGVVQYVQIVDDLTHEPDYDAALDAARKLV